MPYKYKRGTKRSRSKYDKLNYVPPESPPRILPKRSVLFEDVNHDPIGFHIIELRKYYLYLHEQLEEKQLEAKQKEPEKLPKKGKSKSSKGKEEKNENLAYPEFPSNYPFCQSFEKTRLNSNRAMIKFTGEMSKHHLEKERVAFIKRVMGQAGILDIEDEKNVVNYLSSILHDFLQKFARLLYRNKNSEPFSKDKGLTNALETTLRRFGICGVSALHVFYYDNIVKKHDILERECKDLHNQLLKSSCNKTSEVGPTHC